MYLSEFQKKVILSFQPGDTYDFYSLINEIKEVKLNPYTGRDMSFSMFNLALNQAKTIHIATLKKIYFYENFDSEKVKTKISEFIFLCDYLERIKLIRAIKLSDGANVKFIPILKAEYQGGINHTSINDVINQLAFERYEWKFLISPAILKFIENNFLTDEEVHLHLESIDRKESLIEAKISRLNTRNFAIASLAVALLANIVTIYYSQKNVELFTNERKISIVEDKSRKDTNKVLLIGKETIYDTIKVNDTAIIKNK